MMLLKYSLIIFSWLFLLVGSAFAQKAANIKVSTTDDQLIIEYDLTGNSDALYEVELEIKQADGTYISPKTLRGDIGKVTAGPAKTIVWEVYKDVSGLEGNIEPEFKVAEVKKADLKPQPTPTPPEPQSPLVDVKINKVKYSEKALRFGAKLSTGRSRVVSSENGFSKKYSWQGGAYFRWNIHRKVYLQPELLFHRQSFREMGNNDEGLNYNLHYARGQVLGGFKPIGLGLYFNAGLYYGQLLGGNEKVEIGEQETQTFLRDLPVQNNEKLPYLNYDAGYIIGGTLSFNKGAFAIGVLHSQGFNNMVNEAYWANDIEQQNRRLRNVSTHFFIQKSLVKSKRKPSGQRLFQNNF